MNELFKRIERKKLTSLMEEYSACLKHMKLLLMILGEETVQKRYRECEREQRRKANHCAF